VGLKPYGSFRVNSKNIGTSPRATLLKKISCIEACRCNHSGIPFSVFTKTVAEIKTGISKEAVDKDKPVQEISIA
jgi:hypothetical protein